MQNCTWTQVTYSSCICPSFIIPISCVFIVVILITFPTVVIETQHDSWDILVFCFQNKSIFLFLSFCMSVCWPWFFIFYCTPTAPTAAMRSWIRETEWRKTTSNLTLFINNWGWEQRMNVPTSLQKGELGTVGSSKWRCWNIKDVSVQKSRNMVSANCKQHSHVCLAQLVCEASYQSNESVKRSMSDICIVSIWITLERDWCNSICEKLIATVRTLDTVKSCLIM